MRKSARLLGQHLGLSAREMNALLTEHGYLQGAPGNYSVTDKGRPCAHEVDEERGNSRSMSYYTSWSTRSWDEEILKELADMPPVQQGSDTGPPATAETGSRDTSADADDAFDELGNYRPLTDFDDEDDQAPTPPVWLAAALIVSVRVANSPRVREWVQDTVHPAAQQWWRKAKSRRSSGR